MDLSVNRIIKRIVSVIICSFLFSAQAYAWTIFSDFESGTVGERSTFADGMGGRAMTFISDKYALNGNQSLEFGIVQGTEGKEWGGRMEFPTALKEGDELWLRIFYYFPVGFDFTAGGSGLKLSRVHTTSPSGAHEAYITLHAQGNIGMGNSVGGDLFVQNNPGESGRKGGETIPKGEWHAIEHYLKFHSEPGKAKYRVWQNGKLVFEDTLTNTLESSSSLVRGYAMFTYWNGNAPQTQQNYIDDIAVTNNVPSNTDSFGNSYIGVGDFVTMARPKPPLLTIE